MKIQYRHASDPDKIKIFDTVKSLHNNPFINQNQEVYDARTLIQMESDMNILEYKVISD
jgi:hypothetical protein